MSIRTSAVALSLLAAALLAACSSTDLSDKAPVETRTPVPNTGPSTGASSGATSQATPQSQVATVDLNAQGSKTAAQRVLYFDFDSFVIKDEFRPMLEANAKALVAARNKRITVEGHTDERGGSEYNLALGQKRAEAVAKSLTLLGVAESQVEPVSFGKERPADPGHDEDAWAKNRRAELKDR